MTPAPPVRETVKAANPYLGPRPFDKLDGYRFFGRDLEVSELYSLVAAHRTVLLYAQSGAGKTSLLNAGLIPALERGDPVRERWGQGPAAGMPLGFDVLPMARVSGIPEPVLGGGANIYVVNTIASWADDTITSCATLADVLAYRPRRLDTEGVVLPRVAMFDQFEELFTAYPQCWQERRGFFEQLNKAMTADRSLRVLFAMREDFLGHVHPYEDLLSEELRTRYRLEQLREGSARVAVAKPLEGTGVRFKPGVAERLVNDLLRTPVSSVLGSYGGKGSSEGKTEDKKTSVSYVAGEFVEPVQLQVVCFNLFRNLPPGTTLISEEHLSAFGNVDQALLDFYQDALKETAAKTSIEEDRLRQWFETNLITEAESRGLVFRGESDTGGIPNVAVDVLDGLHLIRAELRGGQCWYELSHDRFIQPILRANDAWRERAQAQEIQLRENQVRLEQEARQARTLRKLAWALAAMLLLALIASGLALKANRLATVRYKEAIAAGHLARQRLEEIKTNLLIREAALSGNQDNLNKLLGSLRQNTSIQFGVTATDLNSRDGKRREIYRFRLYPKKDSLGSSENIALITYLADHPTFKNTLMTAGPQRDFAVNYDGWGCLSRITALVEYTNPEQQPTVTDFDGCPQSSR